MTRTVVIALPYFAENASRIAHAIEGRYVPYQDNAFSEAFKNADRIIALMAIGIVMRKIAPLLTDKWRDPGVVVVSPDLKYAIPLCGGHHGANDLAYALQDTLGLIPVITTATEAAKVDSAEKIASEKGLRIVNTDSTRGSNAAVLTGKAGIFTVDTPGMVIATKGVSFLVSDAPYTAGIGCRKGTLASEIIQAIHNALSSQGLKLSDISIYATSTMKLHEPGLMEAIRTVCGNLIYLDHQTLCSEEPVTESAAERFGIPGVAEPAALAVSYKKELVMEKKIYGNVTIAIAR
jgi:cobalt-precorrin 5A hydrolase